MTLLDVSGSVSSDDRPPQTTQLISNLPVIEGFVKQKLAIGLEADFLKVLANTGSIMKHLKNITIFREILLGGYCYTLIVLRLELAACLMIDCMPPPYPPLLELMDLMSMIRSS